MSYKIRQTIQWNQVNNTLENENYKKEIEIIKKNQTVTVISIRGSVQASW